MSLIWKLYMHIRCSLEEIAATWYIGVVSGHPDLQRDTPHTASESKVSSIGITFRPLLWWWWWKMAALPLPAAILDYLISGYPGIRSSKMAAGSGRAAIFHHHHNRGRKVIPKSWLTSLPAPPSWNQDGGATSNVWRTTGLPWRCPILRKGWS